jgi:hypothetical protein
MSLRFDQETQFSAKFGIRDIGHSLARTFAVNPNRRAVGRNILRTQPAQFANANARRNHKADRNREHHITPAWAGHVYTSKRR